VHTRPPIATTAQLAMIRDLLRRAQCYDLNTVTLMHSNLGVDERWQGRPVDLWLGSLSRVEASRVLTELQRATA
jgi:hypothetical protein